MFDRFTDRARNALGLARQVSVRLKHDYIAPEHMLIGLGEAQGFGFEILEESGVPLRRICASLERALVPGDVTHRQGRIPFTPSAKRVLENAFDGSLVLGTDHIGTEHLLLGLVHDDGMAGQALKDAGVDPAAAKDAIRTQPRPPRSGPVLVFSADDQVVAEIIRPALVAMGKTRIHVENPEFPVSRDSIVEAICGPATVAIAVNPVTAGLAFPAGLCLGVGMETAIYWTRPDELPRSMHGAIVVSTREELEAFLRDSM